MVQKSLQQLIVGMLILTSLLGMLLLGPRLHFIYHINVVLSYAIAFVSSAVVTGIMHTMPLMLGSGVIFYNNLWRKSQERSIKHQCPLYESYLITLVRPLVFQLMFFIPLMFLIGYFLQHHDVTGAISDTFQIVVGYFSLFLLGVASRIGFEYFETWKQKRFKDE